MRSSASWKRSGVAPSRGPAAEMLLRMTIQLLAKVHQTGVRLSKVDFRPFAQRVCRSKTLPHWTAFIRPRDMQVDLSCAPAPTWLASMGGGNQVFLVDLAWQRSHCAGRVSHCPRRTQEMEHFWRLLGPNATTGKQTPCPYWGHLIQEDAKVLHW